MSMTRKLSSRVAPVIRKISTMSFLKVMEPSLDPKVFNVNEVAVGVNLLLLYGFGTLFHAKKTCNRRAPIMLKCKNRSSGKENLVAAGTAELP
ncbi:hypothetical protein B9Z55_006108 [Caenorhabditis nigoni]|uniref:Uncharacterized protein n=1 Tax=Caenorhabditis nigoni TaxID=1611254 RepID=A0A2G5V3T3_9PELO|nr:hypothetical protein B9Z55_006108 [Caenorhabditis nigoni]